MKTIAIAAQKGGCGKTSTTIAVSAWLHDDGKKVLVVDLDNQCNTSFVLSDGKTAAQYQNITDALKGKGRGKPLQPCQNGFILPSTRFLFDTDIKTTGAIKTAIEAYSSDIDYCILDCPPALGNITAAALTASDFVVVTIKPDLFGYSAAKATAEMIQTAQARTNSKLRFLGVLPCMVNSRTRLAADFIEALEKLTAAYSCRLYPPIRSSTAIAEAQALREGNIFEYAPKVSATQDYRAFCELLKGDIE